MKPEETVVVYEEPVVETYTKTSLDEQFMDVFAQSFDDF
jgi:hypothetical protein